MSPFHTLRIGRLLISECSDGPFVAWLPAVPAGSATCSLASRHCKSDHSGQKDNDGYDPHRMKSKSKSAEQQGQEEHQENDTHFVSPISQSIAPMSPLE